MSVDVNVVSIECRSLYHPLVVSSPLSVDVDVVLVQRLCSPPSVDADVFSIQSPPSTIRRIFRSLVNVETSSVT